jgi:glycosyltransferase involved in cell wall biosynthesis
LFGEGPLRESLEARAAALTLGGRFVFGGFVKDVARTMAAFDMSVFPSLWEGTPLTLFETLAAGLPIVATDADGLRDVLSDGRDALIVPRRDAPALAARMIELVDSPALRARLSAEAVTTARQYDIDAFVRKMEQLYRVLHAQSRTTRRHVQRAADLSFLTRRA